MSHTFYLELHNIKTLVDKALPILSVFRALPGLQDVESKDMIVNSLQFDLDGQPMLVFETTLIRQPAPGDLFILALKEAASSSSPRDFHRVLGKELILRRTHDLGGHPHYMETIGLGYLGGLSGCDLSPIQTLFFEHLDPVIH